MQEQVIFSSHGVANDNLFFNYTGRGKDRQAGGVLPFRRPRRDFPPQPEVLASRHAAAAFPQHSGRRGIYAINAFRLSMRDLGFVEGRNVTYEIRTETESTDESLARMAVELSGLPLDAVLVANTPPTLAMRQAVSLTTARTMPIVMIEVGDPEASGLASNLVRPGGNITGMTNLDSELAAKRLQLLKEAAPALKRIAVLGNPENPVFAPQLRNVEAAARTLDVELLREDVSGTSELERAFDRIVERKADGVLRLIGFRSQAGLKRLAELVARHRLPCCTDRASEVRDGLLMSYGPNTASAYRQAARIVDKILQGASPAGLPIEQPQKFDLTVNLGTVKALGIVFPASILARTTETVR